MSDRAEDKVLLAHKEDIVKRYQELAPSYDNDMQALNWNVPHHAASVLLRHIEPSSAVCDVGAGMISGASPTHRHAQALGRSGRRCAQATPSQGSSMLWTRALTCCVKPRTRGGIETVPRSPSRSYLPLASTTRWSVLEC